MKNYYSGLDGLRALAIISVIFYHLLPNVFKGGFLGVPLFFAISGFLIVTPLVEEKIETNKIDFKSFFTKRIKRIYPSLIIMLIVVGIVAKLGLDDNNYLGEGISSLLGVNNWWQLTNNVSYFEEFKEINLLKHMWSLSVELQFYLLIPFLINKIINLRKNQLRRFKEFFMIVTLASWLILVFVYFLKGNSVVYYLFTARIFSFSLGILASYYFHYRKMYITFPVGLVILASLLGLIFLVDDYKTVTYVMWLFIASLIGSLLIISIVSSSRMNRLLSIKVFRYIGVRSYDIFLWYFPVITVYQIYTNWDGSNNFLHITIQSVLIMTLANISFYLSQVIRGVGEKKIIFKLLFSLEIFLVICISMATYEAVLANLIKQEDQEIVGKSKTEKESSTQKEKTSLSEEKSITETTSSKEQISESDSQTISKSVLFIGDSVMSGAEEKIKEHFTNPNTIFKTKVGKQPYEILNDLKEVSLSKYEVIIIGLGSNGLIRRNEFDEVLDILKGKEIVFITTSVNKPWKVSSNELMTIYSETNDNVYLFDWDKILSESEDYQKYVVEDNIHLTDQGSQVYVDNLMELVRDIKK